MGLRGVLCGVVLGTLASTSPAWSQGQQTPLAEAERDPLFANFAESWYPQSIERRRPPFFDGGVYTRLDYVPLDGAAEAWDVCAVLPPEDFEYFRALAGGLRAEASRQGVRLTLEHVESFDVEAQAQLVEACLENDSDAIILSAVERDGFGSLLSRAYARRVPVIDAVTGVDHGRLTARIATDRVDVGRVAGNFLADRHPAGAERARTVWIYGPPGSAVGAELDRGFRAGIEGSSVEIVRALEIPLTERAIREAIRDAVDELGSFEALVGGSRTIELAFEELAADFPPGSIELVSVTLASSTLNGIGAGQVFAAVNDKVVVQGRIAVDLAVRAIEGIDHLADLRPSLQIIDRSNVDKFDRSTVLPPD